MRPSPSRTFALLALALSCACGDASGPAEVVAPADARYALADFLKPRMDEGELDPYLAPLFYLEAGEDGAAPLPGAVTIDQDDRLRVDPERPVIYWTDRHESLGDRSLRQLTFVWFRSLGPGDPVAQGVRVTHDSRNFPVVFEVLADGGERPVLYVSRDLEERAAKAFGPPLEGKRHAVENEAPIRLAALVSNGMMPMGPYVYLGAAPDVADLHCRCSPTQADAIRESVDYELLPLELLEGIWPDATRDATFPPPNVLEQRLRLPREL